MRGSLFSRATESSSRKEHVRSPLLGKPSDTDPSPLTQEVGLELKCRQFSGAPPTTPASSSLDVFLGETDFTSEDFKSLEEVLSTWASFGYI